MECPVCKTVNAGRNQKNCSYCNTDLEIFSMLEKIEKKIRRQRLTINYLAVILILLFVMISAGYIYFLKKDKSAVNTAFEKIKMQEIEIRNLQQEKQLLTGSILELRKESDSLNSMLNSLTEQLKTAKSEPEHREIFHVVKRGESLQRIALKYYGNSDEFRRIMQDNNIRNPNSITINQRLKIVNPLNE